MFNNIGNKVKGLAIFVFAIGVIASFAGTAALLITFAAKLSPLIVLLGAAVFAAGCLGAWVCSWVIYCIGDTNVKTTEAQEQLEELQEQIRRLSGKSPAKPKKDAAPEKSLRNRRIGRHPNQSRRQIRRRRRRRSSRTPKTGRRSASAASADSNRCRSGSRPCITACPERYARSVIGSSFRTIRMRTNRNHG